MEKIVKKEEPKKEEIKKELPKAKPLISGKKHPSTNMIAVP